MTLTRKPLDEIEIDDIQELCGDQTLEGHELELKRDLPARGRGRDSWWEGQQGVGEYARNELAKEIVAFANTYGGTLVLGIEETEDKPSRAKAVAPLPQVHDLSRRLRQAIYGIIDPPLPILEAVGVVTESDGTSGVLLLRVPPSRRRPHRSNANREVYIRRADESVVVDMREIQELTIAALAEARRVDDEITKGRASFLTTFYEWLGTEEYSESMGSGVVVKQVPKAGTAIQFLAVPTAPIDLGRLAGRQELYPQFRQFDVSVGGHKDQAMWPFALHVWKPALRAVAAELTEPQFSLQSSY